MCKYISFFVAVELPACFASVCENLNGSHWEWLLKQDSQVASVRGFGSVRTPRLVSTETSAVYLLQLLSETWVKKGIFLQSSLQNESLHLFWCSLMIHDYIYVTVKLLWVLLNMYLYCKIFRLSLLNGSYQCRLVILYIKFEFDTLPA